MLFRSIREIFQSVETAAALNNSMSELIEILVQSTLKKNYKSYQFQRFRNKTLLINYLVLTLFENQVFSTNILHFGHFCLLI